MQPGLKTRGVDDAIKLVPDAAGNDARFRDFVHSPAVSVDKRHAVTVERLKVFVVKARPFAQLPVPCPQLLSRRRIADNGPHPGANLLHLLEVGVLVRAPDRVRGPLLRWMRHNLRLDAAGDRGPAIHDEVVVHPDAGLVVGEVSQPPLLPARGRDRSEPGRIDWSVIARIDGRRRPLEHVEVLAPIGEVRDGLHRGCAGADDADSLVAKS